MMISLMIFATMVMIMMMIIICNFYFKFSNSNNDINVENCLCPKWLLCVSVIDNFRYRAAVAVKKILFFNTKKI